MNGTSVFAETIPPEDSYATRTPPNPKQGTTLETIQGYVTDAAAHGGGWVQLVFHHLCDGCDAYSITPATFDALLTWLEGQVGERGGGPNHAPSGWWRRAAAGPAVGRSSRAARHTRPVIVRLTLAYDGSGFRGWARNAGQRTVEGVLSDALARVLGDDPKLSVAGRTDAGVHARGQVASFVADYDVDLERLQRSINGMLAPEVVAEEVRRAPEGFDARFSATAREYRYRIDTGPWPDPFEARFVWHRPGELAVSVDAGGRAVLCSASTISPPSAGGRNRAGRCGGWSGCRSLAWATASRSRRGRTRSCIRWCGPSSGRSSRWETAVSNAGTVHEILVARDRSRTPEMAPAHGLTLERVVYGRRASST